MGMFALCSAAGARLRGEYDGAAADKKPLIAQQQAHALAVITPHTTSLSATVNNNAVRLDAFVHLQLNTITNHCYSLHNYIFISYKSYIKLERLDLHLRIGKKTRE